MAFTHLIGIDEVGRGPLAGPLCVGGCALLRTHAGAFFHCLRGIKDSKQLPPEEREAWDRKIRTLERDGVIAVTTAFISEREIDEGGLGPALSAAVALVLRQLSAPEESSFIMLDGTLRAPRQYLFQESVIGGDEADPLIAAASIVAKVERDRIMVESGKRFPEYGFERHKGYGTRAHYKALREHGPCELHRKSFLREFMRRAKAGQFETVHF